MAPPKKKPKTQQRPLSAFFSPTSGSNAPAESSSGAASPGLASSSIVAPAELETTAKVPAEPLLIGPTANCHCCDYPGCTKSFASRGGLLKHRRNHKFAAATAAALPPSAYKKVDRYVPAENLRDYRRVRNDHLACTGYECAVVQGKDDAKRAVAHRKELQVLAKKGKEFFGDMDVYCFKAEVQRRLNHDLPAVLSDFHFKEASNLLGCAVSALTEYMTACFVAYETEIHRLNAIIVRLKLDNKKLKKKMEELCGPADNVVAVPKEPDRKAHITRSEAGAAGHLTVVQSAKVGSIVAAHSELEPEMWFLGEVVKEAYKPNVSLTGERGEKVAEGEWHVLLQKYEDVEGGENFYARLEEDEGRLHVKAEDVITIDIKVVTSRMGEAAMITALGGEEIYSQMTRKETRRITSGMGSYLPGAERERVWNNCPR